jgi:hypothetical protein
MVGQKGRSLMSRYTSVLVVAAATALAGCVTGPNVGTTWNDRISSFQGFSNCQIRIYENANFTGATDGAFTATDYVGDAMNDRTTSVRYY